MGGDSFADLWARLSGAELLQEMADGHVPPPPHAVHVGLSISAISDGQIECAWRPPAEVCNSAGDVHGGYLAMVLDDAAALACTTLGERYRPMLTLSLNLDFMRTVQAGETYRVAGVVIHPGRRRMIADAEITDRERRLLARATGSFTPNEAFDPTPPPR